MKMIQARYDLMRYVFLPFCLVTTVVYLYFFHILTTLSLVNWIFVLCLLGLSLSSTGRQRLGNGAEPTCSRGKWLGSLFMSQLLINLLCWSVFHPSSQFVFSTAAFPAGFIVFVALTLGYFTYRQGDLGLVSSAYKPFFGNTHLDSVGVAVDTYMRIVTFSVTACLLTLLTIGVATLLHDWLGLPLVLGLKPTIVFIGSILLLGISQPAWLKLIHYFMYQRIPTTVILIGCSLVLGVVYLFLSAIADKIVLLNPMLNESYLISALTTQDHKMITMTLFWLSLGALVGGYIASISQHRRIREIILSTLGMNILGWGLLFLLIRLTAQEYSSIFSLILMSSVCVFALIAILRKDNYTHFLRATLPTKEPLKPRSSFRTLKIMPLVMVTLCCGYFAVGFAAFSYLMVFVLFPCLMLILISFAGLGKAIKQGGSNILL